MNADLHGLKINIKKSIKKICVYLSNFGSEKKIGHRSTQVHADKKYSDKI